MALEALSKINPTKANPSPVKSAAKRLAKTEIEKKIQRVCTAGMHYTDFFTAIGKIVSGDAIPHDDLIANASFFEQYVSSESETMKVKSIESVIEEHRKSYSDQVGSRAFEKQNTPALSPNEIGPFEEKFRKSIMDQGKEYPAPIPVIQLIQGDSTIPILTLKSFSLFQGKQKSRKTTLLAIMIASFISGTQNQPGVYFEGVVEGSVLFFDNEQGESYAARTMKLILKLVGLQSSKKLIYCDLREYSPTDRSKIIEAGIRCTPDVKIVVIDGLVDLLNDFMDASEGHLSITNIIRLCSEFNIHIAGVLHQNKNDKNARAHVGTISSQKCEIEITTEVDPSDKHQSIVSCVNSRGLPFESLALTWEKGSLPAIVQNWTNTAAAGEKAAQKMNTVKEIANSVFKPFAALKNKDAVEGLMKASSKSESAAKRYLTDLLGWDIVVKGPDGLYRINMEKGSRVHEGSNGFK